MERKEELQEQCHSMKKLLEQESSINAGLKQELSENSRKAKESTDKMQARINSISRENELLKHQLKKYVGAVDRLQKNTDLKVPIFIRYVCAQTCNLLAYNAS